jgi:hypothetical protein
MKPLVVSIVVLVTAAALLGAFPATVSADQPTPLKGRTEYTLTAVEPDGTLSDSGTGHATHLGLFTADVSVFPNGDGTFSLSGAFTAANGDRIPFIGEGEFTSSTSAMGTATITGGTGRFADATGGAVFMDVSDPSLEHIDQTFRGNDPVLAAGWPRQSERL